MKVNYLIVGQGIAGTMMAYSLLEAGKTVCVIDSGLPSASSVAAGLFNPVTGRRFVKSWMIEKLLPHADAVYTGLERLLNIKLLYRKPIVRILNGDEEKVVYDRSLTSENQNYIEGFYGSSSENQYAYCEIKQGGYVDTYSLIHSFRTYLLNQSCFRLEEFDFDNLIVNADGIQWKDIEADEIIFCEGYKAVKNPYFPNLPFNLAKGEILTLKIPGLNEDKILMAGAYLVPLGNDIFKLGSTYEWIDLLPEPTTDGREMLIQKLKAITTLPFEILDHEAGIRPTVKNRRPMLGRHSIYPNLSILNGMGTKGVLLAPYFGAQLCEHLVNGEGIDKEVDVRQYM